MTAKHLSENGQPMRLLRWLRTHQGASSREIIEALDIINVTGRISDLRAHKAEIDCRTGEDGIDRYWLVKEPEPVREPRPVTTGEQIGLSL